MVQQKKKRKAGEIKVLALEHLDICLLRGSNVEVPAPLLLVRTQKQKTKTGERADPAPKTNAIASRRMNRRANPFDNEEHKLHRTKQKI
jgi:hypothetical protein